ncbi:hypothetical protein E4V42_13425 [Clostridium estertheticum]|uniref:Uncharacterized protein n=1 Tax=Clostridium estertheticum TaxID=238834 RepID=A0A5N7IQ48_9CLOT|nr:hypothetical protein [Clostridium estertheticum]MPQ32433.1 hypothetical protein [Clostridium estertheticum]MPQ63092.1 hypothetical protein [Clostridium estertheticum]
MIESSIDFKKPRQKMWGILKDKTLTQLPFGHESDNLGVEKMSYATNCYTDALEEAHTLIAKGSGTRNVQIIEFVPYDYMMQPRV